MRNSPADLLLSFSQIAAMLKSRLRLILTLTFGATILAAVLSTLLPKTYIASADLFIDYRMNDPIGGRQFHPLQDESYLQTQFDVIRSIQVAERVIDALNLLDSAQSRELLKKYGEQGAKRALAETILRNIEISPRKNSRVIEVTYSAADPVHARDMVNTLLKIYVEISLEMMSAPAKARKEQYNAQLESMTKQIDELQKKLTAYQQQYQIVDVDERADRELRQMSAISTKLLDIQIQRMDAQTRRQALNRLISEGNAQSDIPEIANIGHISGVKAALVSIEAQLANAKVNLGPRHPKYLSILEERNELLDKLKRESATAIESLSTNERRLIEQERALQSELDSYQKKTFENKKHRDIISSYQRQIDSVQKIYNAAIQKYDELLMTSNVTIPGASVLQWADIPQKHAKPLLRNNLIFGFVGGFALSLFLAFLLELMNRKIRCREDLEREFDLPVMARIGFEEILPKDQMGLVNVGEVRRDG